MPTLDTTVGGAAANSYVGLSAAGEYFAGSPAFAEIWSGLSSTAQVQWLVEAARAVDRLDFAGEPLSTGQALAFPRLSPEGTTWAVDGQGQAAIPAKVQAAQLEAVRWLKRNLGPDDSADDRPPAGLNLAGGLSLTWAEAARVNPLAGGTAKTVAGLLREFRDPGRLVRG